MALISLPEHLVVNPHISDSKRIQLQSEFANWLQQQGIEYAVVACRFRITWQNNAGVRRNHYHRSYQLEMDDRSAMLCKLSWC